VRDLKSRRVDLDFKPITDTRFVSARNGVVLETTCVRSTILQM